MTQVRVELRSLHCINNSDEFGIAETDEVRILFRGFLEGGDAPWKKWRKENVDDNDWAIKSNKPLALWSGELAKGSSVVVQCLVFEEGGRGLPGDIVQFLAGGLLGPGVGLFAGLLTNRNDDYIGGFQLRVANSASGVSKELQCLKQCRVGGYKEFRYLSESHRTVRIRMKHTLPGDNIVDYHASVNVWDLGVSSTDALIWTAEEGSRTAR